MLEDAAASASDLDGLPPVDERARPSEWTTDNAASPSLLTLYLRDVRRFGRLPPENETLLLGRFIDGNADARHALICHHLGLVIAMARGFANRGLELLDLIGEGNLGMLAALQKFELDRGVRFSTYAAWWIRYYLQTAIATQVPIVRPPLRVQQLAARKAWQHWHAQHDASTVATGETESALKSRAAGRLVTALPLHDQDVEAHLQEAGIQQRDVFDEFADDHDALRLAGLLRELVERLPSRQRDIIVARFGLDGQDESTLDDLGKQGGVTRERIRQLQVAALAALRESLEHLGITREIALS